MGRAQPLKKVDVSSGRLSASPCGNSSRNQNARSCVERLQSARTTTTRRTGERSAGCSEQDARCKVALPSGSSIDANEYRLDGDMPLNMVLPFTTNLLYYICILV